MICRLSYDSDSVDGCCVPETDRYALQESYTNFRPLTWTENWDPEMTYVFGVLCVQVIIFGLVGMYLMMVMPRNMGRRESVLFPIVWMWRLISRKETIAVDDAQVHLVVLVVHRITELLFF